jgi:hypothetical protein
MGVGVRADYQRNILGINAFKVGKTWNTALMIGYKF